MRACRAADVLGLVLLNMQVFPEPRSRLPASRLVKGVWAQSRRLKLNQVLVAKAADGALVGSVEVHTREFLRSQAPSLTDE